jgi:AraC-like DNA-binding protein
MAISLTALARPPLVLSTAVNSLFEQVHIRIHGLCCVQLQADPRPWHRLDHGDPFWRLYWNEHDGALLQHTGGVLPLRADAIHLVPPGCIYHCVSPVAQRHLFVHLELQPLPLTVQEALFPEPFSLPAQGFHATAPLLAAVLRGQDAVDPLSLSLQGRGLAAAALGQAFALLEAGQQDQLRSLLDGRDPIQPALLAIADDPAQAWRMTDLAGRCRLSVRGFHDAFRRSLGMAPSRYLQIERLRHTAAILLASTASIEDIALDCGFHDRAHLTRQFRHHFHTTPHAYRRSANLLIARSDA